MVKSGMKILLDALKGQGLTNPNDFQVGKTKLFMRDKQVRLCRCPCTTIRMRLFTSQLLLLPLS
jgi:hypothetical protein